MYSPAPPYHMVTGQPPFPGTKIDSSEAHLKTELTPPDHLNTKLSPDWESQNS